MYPNVGSTVVCLNLYLSYNLVSGDNLCIGIIDTYTLEIVGYKAGFSITGREVAKTVLKSIITRGIQGKLTILGIRRSRGYALKKVSLKSDLTLLSSDNPKKKVQVRASALKASYSRFGYRCFRLLNRLLRQKPRSHRLLNVLI